VRPARAPEPERAWRRTASGLIVRLRLTPGSSRDAIEGVAPTAEGPALKARVRAVPEDGAANAAAAALLAKWLGVPKSAVAIASGHKSRVKCFRVAGEAGAIEARLAAQAGDGD
jgi:hypothetical protein